MGFCFSCCRRQRSPEQDPLLPRHSSNIHDPLPRPESHLDKAADVLAAINAGKLPSQDQLNRVLQICLRSDVLDTGSYGKASSFGYGSLSESGRKVVADAREVLDAVLRIGLEKNSDNRLQDLLFHVERIDAESINADVAVNINDDKLPSDLETVVTELPTTDEIKRDTRGLLTSLKLLTRLLLTSSAFRLIMSDVFLTVREMLADSAAEVSSAALRAQAAAAQVENALRPEGIDAEALKVTNFVEQIDNLGRVVQNRSDQLGSEGPDRIKEIVIQRLQQIFVQSHRNPQYQAAVRSILLIIRKYARKLRTVRSTVSEATPTSSSTPVTLTPVIWTDEHVTTAFADLKIVSERFASGHSLDPVLTLFNSSMAHITNAPDEDLSNFFTALGQWFDDALSNPAYATSFSGTHTAEILYDRGRALLAAESNAQWAHDLRSLSDEATSFIDALHNDRASQQFLNAVDSLSSDLANLSNDAVTAGTVAQRNWREELKRDFIAWFVPRMLKAILGVVPMPRVEYKSKSLDVVLDAALLNLGSADASLLPDHVRVQNWSEMRLDAQQESDGNDDSMTTALAGGMQSFNRIKIHIDGVRMSVGGIGYHLRYKGLIGYEDQGLVSVEVGGRIGEGLGMDIEVETASDSWIPIGDENTLFRVTDVKVNIPGLAFSIDKSKHWILNKMFLQPLSGPIVRHILATVLEEQIRKSLEGLARWLGSIRNHVNAERREAGIEDYWSAILAGVGAASSEEEEVEDADDEMEPMSPQVETHTAPTLKGVVRTTVTQADPFSSNPPTPDESVLAVGIGSQVLHDEAGPYEENEGEAQASIGASGKDALNEIRDAVDGTVERSKQSAVETTERARQTREDIERAQARVEVRRRLEGKRKGWRSKAFDV